MNIKIITAIIAFVATFGTSSAITKLFVGKSASLAFAKTNVDAQTQQKIVALLRRDIKNGDERFGKLAQTGFYSEPFSAQSLAQYSEAVSQYHMKSASMDDADLPADFQSIWRQHMKAWGDHAILVEQLKKAAEAEEMTDNEIYTALVTQSNEINRTWYKALRIAGGYNANPYRAK